MISQAHSAVIAFARGGLVSLVGLLLPSTVTMLIDGDVRSVGPLLRTVLPVAGFVVGGVIGAAGVAPSARGRLGFGAGFGVAGLILTPLYASLQGLSGRENLGVVVGVVLPGFVLAYGAAGAIGGWLTSLNPSVRRASHLGFAIGGAIGALLILVPFFLSKAGSRPGGYAGLLAVTLSSVGAFVVPSTIGGAWLGRALEAEGERREAGSERD